MYPLEFAVNFTPNSTGSVSFVSFIAGVSVLGQIVHGQVVVAAFVAVI